MSDRTSREPSLLLGGEDRDDSGMRREVRLGKADRRGMGCEELRWLQGNSLSGQLDAMTARLTAFPRLREHDPRQRQAVCKTAAGARFLRNDDAQQCSEAVYTRHL